MKNYSLLEVPSIGFMALQKKTSNSPDKKSMLNENLLNTIDKIFLLLASFPISIQLCTFQWMASVPTDKPCVKAPSILDHSERIYHDNSIGFFQNNLQRWESVFGFLVSSFVHHQLTHTPYQQTLKHMYDSNHGYSQTSQGTHVPNHKTHTLHLLDL